MKNLFLGLSLLVCSFAFAQESAPPAMRCDANENLAMNANVANPQTDGSVIFQSPSCKVTDKYIPLVMSLTGLPLKVVSDGYYCNLKGYQRVTESSHLGDMITMVDLNKDGTIDEVQVMNSIYFTAIGCADKIQ